MKRFFTFCCAILGMGATMYGASADLSDYLNTGDGGGSSSSFTITTNEDGTLTFSGSYTDTDTSDGSDSSYSVSFVIAAEANGGDLNNTYTVTMSNFAISGSLSSAFGNNNSVTASATGITSIEVSAGYVVDAMTDGLPIEITGQGNGTRTTDISSYLSLLDLLGGNLSSFASAVTVTMTCTSGATLAIKVNEAETITCGFTVDENTGISFSADGLENIFDELTVEGDIETVLAGEDDVTNEVIAKEDIDILVLFGSSGYGSEFTYDSETNTATIVYSGSWSGRGIWGGSYLVNENDGVTKVEGGTEPTSISSIQTKDAVEVARYNLMGQKISGAERGINIIVYSDGSAKKVLVK